MTKVDLYHSDDPENNFTFFATTETSHCGALKLPDGLKRYIRVCPVLNDIHKDTETD